MRPPAAGVYDNFVSITLPEDCEGTADRVNGTSEQAAGVLAKGKPD